MRHEELTMKATLQVANLRVEEPAFKAEHVGETCAELSRAEG